MTRNVVVAIAVLGTAAVMPAQEAVRLVERFSPTDSYRVEAKTDITGRLTTTAPAGGVAISGTSRIVYDERPLPTDGPAAKVVRAYRLVEIARKLGDRAQASDIRPEVRRMVVLREGGKKAPFSPDGPLLWGEIDVVRADLFLPAVVPGLLPRDAVKPGDKWPAAAVAVADLTDLNPVDSGGLTVTYVGPVTLNNKRFAKLGISGTAAGGSVDGPAKQTIAGTGYFDLDASRLAYLNVTGTHELFDPAGKAVGRIEGTFVLTRGPAGKTDDIADGAVKGVSPTPENTLLKYDNPTVGVSFVYPRRWRVGAAEGRQVAVDEPGGGGLLVTVEPAGKLPTAEALLAETKADLEKRKATVLGTDGPRDGRFGIDAEVNGKKVRLEYAVVGGASGGATVAARLPWDARAELASDVERVVKSLATR